MSRLICKLSIGSILLSSLALFGCSSGGDSGSAASPAGSVSYSGLSLPSAVTAANAEALTTMGGEAVQQAANSRSSRVLGAQLSNSSDKVEILSANLASAMASAGPLAVLPSGFSMNGSCGGSVTIPDEQLTSFSATSGPASFTVTYNDYCDATVGAQYTVNGQVLFNYTDIGDPNAGFTVEYKGVTFNDGSETITINMTVDCSSLSACEMLSDYVGDDGRTYRVADISFSGDATTGYNGSATFYHPDHGSVSITASNVTYGGCGSFPDGGSVTANSTSTTGSAQIDFNSDCTYVISYDDGAGDTGVINGSFI